MIENTIKYYKRITSEAHKNLKEEKKFQFRKYMTNMSLLRANQSYFEDINNSTAAMELIDKYNRDMQNMYKIARAEYNIVLKKIKATSDPVLKQKLLDDYANDGIIGFKAKNGARWNIETYSNMYTRHVNNELSRLYIIEQSKKQKKEVVKISDHGTKCEICRPWEGKILTYDELQNAKKAGLFHPNCLHVVLFVVRSA